MTTSTSSCTTASGEPTSKEIGTARAAARSSDLLGQSPVGVGRVIAAGPRLAMTSQGTATGRFSRAIQTRNLFMAEVDLKEMGSPSLLLALDYLVLLTTERPEKYPLAALRWHGRFELEARTLTLSESQLALAALVALGDGDTESVEVLRRLLRKVRPTLLPKVS